MPTRDADGGVVGLHGTDQDITARRTLDRLQAEVSHLSRLAAMNAMAATLAHELNQPLAAASNYIVGSRKLLAAGGAQAEQAEEGMLAAQEQVQFAGEIIRRVRSMVSNEPESVAAAMAKVIDDALALGIPAREREKLEVGIRIEPDARYMRGDPVQIQQVLLNLIRNAVEATSGLPRPALRVAVGRSDAEHLLVTVEDNGPGLRDIGAPLFTAFASGKPSGMGLGLSISRTIIEAHGGRIWAESLPAGGARFSFTVPAADAPAE